MTTVFPRIAALGQAAWLLEVGEAIHPQLLARVRAIAETVQEAQLEGLQEVVPAYASVLACFDSRAAARAARPELERLMRTVEPARGPVERHFRIPCCYEGEFAPDLDAVAHHGDRERAIALHTAHDFLVYCLGFLPGFTYLGELPEALAVPRLPVPRTQVPAGSVGIAGRQTGIYPVASPGGWRLIGRTPVRLFDPARRPPAALAPGDIVRFYAITSGEYGRLAQDPPWPLPS